MQIILSTYNATWVKNTLLIASITFKTSFGKTFGPYGSSPNQLQEYNVYVPGQKLAFISGSQGLAIDSLTFHFN